MQLHHTPDLKARRQGWLLTLSLLALALTFAATPARAALQLDVTPEEPSGVFWATDTVKTQTELLFSVRVRNDLAAERPVYLYWRVLDATGKTQLKDDAKFTLAPRAAAVRRILFEAPARGAYLLIVEARARRDGPDDNVAVETPFAIVTTPDTAYRPHSFFSITAPALLSADELRFYQRIGARVLRSAWLPGQSTPDGRPVTETELDAQLQLRASHRLATRAVLPYWPAFGEELWRSRALATATRYPDIALWETDAPAPADARENFAQSFRIARPDAQLFAAMPRTPLSSGSLKGWTTELPALDAQQPSAAIMRLLLTQRDRARDAGGDLRVRQPFGEVNANGNETSAVAVAGRLITRYIMAISAGANGFSAAVPPATREASGPQRLAAMAEAAAFAHMASRLEDTSFSREVWSHLPTLWATVFKTPRQSVAVIWAEAGSGTLKVQWPATAGRAEAKIYDLFGNLIGETDKGRLSIPLGAAPVYVVSDAGPNEAAEAIGKGESSDLPTLAAQVLPVLRQPFDGQAAPLRVTLQNLSIEPAEGTLRLWPPPGWKLKEERRRFSLKPGEYATYEFPVESARLEENGEYWIKAGTDIPNRRGQQWKQTLRTATALNVRDGEKMQVDGTLDEWSDATWMRAAAGEKRSTRPEAQLALKWSADTLYIAAQVREDRLVPRHEDAPEYSFWQDSDAIQLAFGMRAEPWMAPVRGRFRDSDYGFLLSPFRTRADGTVEARVLRLWSPQIAFGALPDRVRYGGSTPGAHCVIRRDETAGVTFYEAALPLRAIPELQPAQRATGTVASGTALSGAPVRFGWIAHNEAGSPLQWSRATDVFPWWNNPGSFLPADSLPGAVQAELGFTQRGEVSSAPPSYAPPRSDAPRSPAARPSARPDTPPVTAPARPVPTPTPAPQPSLPLPYTAPMPIDLLPPAAPVEGDPLPPSTP